jgi:excisionase family DNA binding protein
VKGEMKDWERFVLAHGFRSGRHELATVVGQPPEEIDRIRNTGACSKRSKCKRFAELFALWHGRPPRDEEWPAPRSAHSGSYEWQAPETALLASLVGRLGKPEMAKILTDRMRKLTGDRKARRSPASIQSRLAIIGMQLSDVVGGIAVRAAGREVGAYYMVWNAIKRGQMPSFRVGTVVCIPYAAWAEWKAKRVFPPKGYVQLSTLKRPLSIKSDKLSEWARMGFIPTAVRCNPWSARVRTTKFGTWFLSRGMASKLLRDRRAGRPMPWWGKPDPGNLGITYKLWLARKHPAECKTCAAIWGPQGPPRSFAEYCERYHPLEFGQKRHLTRKWTPGMTVAEVATHVARPRSYVVRAIENGMMESTRIGRWTYVSRTEVTLWKERKCPGGDSGKSWLSLEAASKQYLFTARELSALMDEGKLRSKIGVNGPMRGITYVPKHQLALLRQRRGFSEEDAAIRVGVSVTRLRSLLKGAEWRVGNGLPLETVKTLIRRRKSQDTGLTVEEAAAALHTTVEWINERRADGTIRIQRGKWDRRRCYISGPMLQRLKNARKKPANNEQLGPDWLYANQASVDSGVSVGTIVKWAEDGEVERRRSRSGWRYPRKGLRARARRYWKTVQRQRAVPPEWLRPTDNGSASLRLAPAPSAPLVAGNQI